MPIKRGDESSSDIPSSVPRKPGNEIDAIVTPPLAGERRALKAFLLKGVRTADILALGARREGHGGRYRIRTCDFYRVRIALYR